MFEFTNGNTPRRGFLGTLAATAAAGLASLTPLRLEAQPRGRSPVGMDAAFETWLNRITGKHKMTASEAFVETLVANGVKNVFGIVGSAYMDALDLFPLAGIRFISVAHEQGGGHACDRPWRRSLQCRHNSRLPAKPYRSPPKPSPPCSHSWKS